MVETREQDAINYQRNKLAALTGAKSKAEAASSNAMTNAIGGLGSALMGMGQS